MTIPLRILVLEDSSDDAELMLRELRRANIDLTWQRVDTEADYLAALETQPDLILADYHLPSYDGLLALTALRSRNLDIPFILISGVVSEELAVTAIKLGAADYVKKDRLQQLPVAITRALEEKKLRDEKRRFEERLIYLSHHDALTGLHNRAFFEDELERLERGRQYPMAIIVADVDRLKVINDTFGHLAGDELIRRAANVLRSAFRGDDILARIGGDEFAALVPHYSHETGQDILFRVNGALEDSAHSDYGQRVSLSIGMAIAQAHDSLTDTFRQADALMYKEKLARRTNKD